MFNFAQKKIDDLENLIQKNYQMLQTLKTQKVTKLDNESKATTDILI